MQRVFAAILLIAFMSGARASGSPEYSVKLVPARDTGEAAAKVDRRGVREPPRIFLSFDALKEFCGTQPEGAILRWAYPGPNNFPPGSRKFTDRFVELQAFCASRGVQFKLWYGE